MSKLVVNLYAGPSAGKSTRIHLIAGMLKQRGIPCEVCPEFAKDEIHRGMPENLKDQLYIFGNQQHILEKLLDIYPIVINDGALMNCIMYDQSGDKDFHNVIYKAYSKHENFNYYLTRDKEIAFTQAGRVHNYEESLKKDKEILTILNSYGIECHDYNLNKIINDIENWYKKHF